ncbi:MAG: hypothetical protein A2293_11365 [Elusimicrobia bacterium RIFOXYB2_FULL_49_7]|nr:MAG: hypothetical protein A2293_11365 [Elusimicrobia bacterium RIFOXYB2_FULL_49_7]
MNSLATFVHLIVQLDIAFASAADYDVSQPSLLQEYGVVEAAIGAGKLYWMLVEPNHICILRYLKPAGAS